MSWFDFRRRHKRRQLAKKGFAQTDKVRRKDPAMRRRRPGRGRLRITNILSWFAVWLVAAVSIAYKRPPPKLRYVVGQIADRYIYSEVRFSYDDLPQTAKRREQVAGKVPPVYRLSNANIESSVQRLNEARLILLSPAPEASVVEDDAPPLPDDLPREGRIPALLRSLPSEGREGLRSLFASADQGDLLTELASDALHAGIPYEEDFTSLALQPGIDTVCILYEAGQSLRRSMVEAAKLKSPSEIAGGVGGEFLQQYSREDPGLRQALLSLLQEVLTPNLVYDRKATEAARATAIAEVPVISRVVPANEVLLSPGMRVTEDDILRLEKHQEALFRAASLRQTLASTVIAPILCLLLLLATLYVLYVLKEDLFLDASHVIMVAVVMGMQVILSRMVADLYTLRSGSAFFLFSILPLSFAGVLLSPLAGLRVAIPATIFTVLVGVQQNADSFGFELATSGGLCAIVGAAMMRRARKRVHAWRTGLAIAGTVFAVEILFLMQKNIPGEILPRVVLTTLIHASLNGFSVALAVTMLLPLFEYVFGVTTEISLVELNDLNHPLLKRLQLEAPGTYHHSLMVATLAEQAAEAIGASALLTRVCAYFHDIGKLAHPEYFTENSQGENPHDELQPRLSSLVILNHVKEGIDLALKYKLKKAIREAISQHHGTSLVYYFYRRAMDRRNGEEAPSVGEEDYRYPGPLPQRKEIALISIADSCEAAARSLEKPTPQKINALVDEIIVRRIKDHQLDHADLTFAELAKVRRTIAHTLGLMFHGRVRYPKEYEREDHPRETGQAAAPRKPDESPQGDPNGPEA